MPGRMMVDDDEQIIADLQRDMRRLRGRLATGQVAGGHDSFVVAGTPLTTYSLTVIPVQGTCELVLNGLKQTEGVDYTVDYSTGVVTVAASLSGGDLLSARYLKTDWLVARSLPPDTGTDLVTLYSIAGFTSNGIAAYDIATDTWPTSPPNFPGAAGTVLAVGTIGGKVYVGMGVDGLGTARAEMYAYDPATNAWATLTSAPTAAKEPAYAVLGGLLYVIGGWNNGTGTLTTVQTYNPATDTWSTVAALPTARRGAVAGVIGGKIYVAAGLTGAGRTGLCHVYDPGTNTWTAKATTGTPVWETTGAAVGGKLYVVGGTDGTGTVVSTVSVYDPVGDSWSTTTAFPRVIAQAAAMDSNGLLAVHGGSTNNGSSGRRTELYLYDPATTVWTAKAVGPDKYGHAMAGV